MRIDSHQHFWKYDPVKDAWIDNTMLAIRKDFLPADLNPLLQKNQIDGCIAIQADQSEKETAFLLNLAAENDFIKGVVGWLDIRNPNMERRLDYFSKHKKLKGLRHIVQAEPDEHFMVHDDFQAGISCLAKFGLLYEILIKPHQLSAAIELVKSFPRQNFVLDHLAKPKIKWGEVEPWAGKIKELATCPNVFCKISGIVTEADWANWKEVDFKPYLDIIFNVFGTSRLMFGSDWPVCLLGASYSQTVQIIENYLEKFHDEERKMVMGQNAVRIYNLK